MIESKNPITITGKNSMNNGYGHDIIITNNFRANIVRDKIAEAYTTQKFITKLKMAGEKFAQRGITPVLLVPSGLRSAIYSFTERFIPGYSVLSHQEITPSTRVQSLGVVAIDE